MLKSYEKMSDKFISEGMPQKEAQKKAARICNILFHKGCYFCCCKSNGVKKNLKGGT